MQSTLVRVIVALAVASIWAPAAQAGTTTCTGFLPPGIYDDVEVPGGTHCEMMHSEIFGSIRVLPRAASLHTLNVVVHGSVEGQAPRDIRLDMTTVVKELTLSDAGSVTVDSSSVGPTTFFAGLADDPFFFDVPAEIVYRGSRLASVDVHIRSEGGRPAGASFVAEDVRIPGNLSLIVDVVEPLEFWEWTSSIKDSRIDGNHELRLRWKNAPSFDPGGRAESTYLNTTIGPLFAYSAAADPSVPPARNLRITLSGVQLATRGDVAYFTSAFDSELTLDQTTVEGDLSERARFDRPGTYTYTSSTQALSVGGNRSTAIHRSPDSQSRVRLRIASVGDRYQGRAGFLTTPASDPCAGIDDSEIDVERGVFQSLSLRGMCGQALITQNVVEEDLEIFKTRGPVVVSGNRAQRLVCRDNDPPVIAFANFFDVMDCMTQLPPVP